MIDNKNQGKNLFRFTKGILPELKNNEIFKLIRKKVIEVNNKKEESGYILRENDVVSIFLKDKHFNDKGKKRKFLSVKKELNIVFEDNDIIVINKPAGLLTHPDKNEYKNNLHEMVRSYLFDKGEYSPDETFTPTPCHRLDRNTSGIVIFAKKHPSLQKITTSLREREAVKIYYTIVCGIVENNILITSTIETKNKIVKVKSLNVLKELPDKAIFLANNPEISATLINNKIIKNELSFIKIELWTGKKHQIRAHLAAIKHPLLGDNKYFTRESKTLAERYKINNYFLHANKLKIDDYPLFIAELPENFKNKVDKLFN